MPPPTIITRSVISPAAAGLQTSTVGEPSLSANGQEALFSGNWYAAHSTNAGQTWNLLNPFSFFPAAARGFCCDQTLIFIPQAGVHVWILQYLKANNTNVLRVAFKSNQLGTRAGWRWWDLVPGTFDPDWSDDWFDYNHCALSTNFLYIGTNMFAGATDTFTRAVMFRIPFSAFAPNAQLTVDRFVTTTNFSLRCVQGASSIMYFGSHDGGSASRLRIFAWPENSSAVTSRTVGVTSWNGGTPYGPVGPGTANWLGRCDGRITGAWLANGRLGFMWSANRQGTARPFPFVRVARIRESDMRLIDEPDIWNGSFAFAYPDASPNAEGAIGIALFAGGNTSHPSHLVGVRAANATTWNLRTVATSTHSPSDNKWGDYLTCRRDHPAANQWVASGFTLQGGGGIANVAPHFVRFRA
ncbi:MAG: hypothetical protein M3177_07620 [Pseudomonadota bacterium]|nr:hypothetical protein [Pseudomonadota bacterium]